MDIRPSTYVRGAWQMGEETVTVTESADGSVLGEVSLGTAEHAAAAVKAAYEAFPAWSATRLDNHSAIGKRMLSEFHPAFVSFDPKSVGAMVKPSDGFAFRSIWKIHRPANLLFNFVE